MDKKRSDYYIKSIRRAIQALNSFTSEEREWGVTELGKKLNLHKSTIHRILITLEDEGFVTKNKVTQKYRLGMKLFELGHIIRYQIEIRTYALPIMEKLSQKTEESVTLSIISGKKRVVIEKVESIHDIRQVIQLGKPIPIYCGASSKLLLAFLPDEEINKIIKKKKLVSLGPNTITNPVKLKKHLEEIRRKGYAISYEERILGSASVAAPIWDYKGEIIASLAIVGPINRFDKKKIPSFLSLVTEAANKLSNLGGGRIPSSKL